MARVRVRQHVNPLSKKYQVPINIPDWQEIYSNPQQPLHLDLGCARGKFVLEMAQLQPEMNFLGLEIRQPLVTAANQRCQELGLTNLHYLFCNVNSSLASVLASLPQEILQQVTIQFPDPWFKNKHGKRRIVQPGLVETLADYLLVGGKVMLQSDVEFVALEMQKVFQNNPRFQQKHTEKWLAYNPLPVATERELFTISSGEPVYRALFSKIGS